MTTESAPRFVSTPRVISKSRKGRLWHISLSPTDLPVRWLCGARTAFPSVFGTPLGLTDVIARMGEGEMCAVCLRRHNAQAEALQRRARSIVERIPSLVAAAVEEAFGSDNKGHAEAELFALATRARGLGCGDLVDLALSDGAGGVLR